MSSLGIAKAVTRSLEYGEGDSWRAWMVADLGSIAHLAVEGLRLGDRRDAFVMYELARLKSEYPGMYSILRAMTAREQLLVQTAIHSFPPRKPS